MEAIQRMRGKAQDKGNLKSSAQQVVETEVVENESVIVIEQARPEIVYVPSYDPVMVYGPPVYPYPPIYYPPAGYYAAGMAVSFGAGVAMGAFWGNGGGWGWGPRWGDNDITINNNNNFVRNANVRSGYRGGTVNNTWQHRPEHRGGAPYRDRTTANKYGGTARGDSLTQRQTSARQEINRQGGNLPSNRVGTSGTSGRTAGAQPGQIGDNVGNRSSAAGLESRTPRSSPSSRPGSADVSSRATGSGADRIGERDVSRSSGGDRNAFGGGHQTYNGSSARADSHRGSSSVRSGGGGASRSGGGRSHGGGGRSHGGGGRRR